MNKVLDKDGNIVGALFGALSPFESFAGHVFVEALNVIHAAGKKPKAVLLAPRGVRGVGS